MSLLDKLKAKTKAIVGDLLTDGADVERKLPQLVQLTEDLDDIFGDGLQWGDISAVFTRVVPKVMQIAESLGGRTGKEKKAFVIDAVYVLYKHYDPDIPRIPNFIENRLEAWFVPMATEMIIDALCPFLFPKKVPFDGDVEPLPGETEDNIDPGVETANETKVLPRSEGPAE